MYKRQGPQSPDFPTNRILCHISHRLLGDATLCINSIKLNMINTALGGQFNLHMQVSMVTGVVLAVPYLLWELWRFVAPALTDYGRYKSRMFVLYVSLCFFTGLLFGYFLIVPLSINFLAGYQDVYKRQVPDNQRIVFPSRSGFRSGPLCECRRNANLLTFSTEYGQIFRRVYYLCVFPYTESGYAGAVSYTHLSGTCSSLPIRSSAATAGSG